MCLQISDSQIYGIATICIGRWIGIFGSRDNSNIYGQLVKLSEGRFRQMRIPMQQLFVSSAQLNHRTFNGCYYIKKVVLFGEVRRKIPGELQVKKKN